jgi:hypothetical protein
LAEVNFPGFLFRGTADKKNARETVLKKSRASATVTEVNETTLFAIVETGSPPSLPYPNPQ